MFATGLEMHQIVEVTNANLLFKSRSAWSAFTADCRNLATDIQNSKTKLYTVPF